MRTLLPELWQAVGPGTLGGMNGDLGSSVRDSGKLETLGGDTRVGRRCGGGEKCRHSRKVNAGERPQGGFHDKGAGVADGDGKGNGESWEWREVCVHGLKFAGEVEEGPARDRTQTGLEKNTVFKTSGTGREGPNMMKTGSSTRGEVLSPILIEN